MHYTYRYNVHKNDVIVHLKVNLTTNLLHYKTDSQMLQIIFKTYSKWTLGSNYLLKSSNINFYLLYKALQVHLN